MRWFTSDQHFWHNNVIRYCDRPFASVEEMNEAMVANWNAMVHPEDTVVSVGDFSMAFRPVELFTPRLVGHKTLVCGNHDFCHPAHKKSRTSEGRDKWTQEYVKNGWEHVVESITTNLEGLENPVNIAHLPYLGDDTDERHAKHRKEDNGLILLCGHVHQKWKHKRTSKGTLMVNVGVDVWGFKPVNETELVQYIRSVI